MTHTHSKQNAEVADAAAEAAVEDVADMEADVAAANAFQGQLCGCFLCVRVLTYSKVMFMFSFLCLGPSRGRQWVLEGGR